MAAFNAERFETLFNEVWDELHRLHTTWALYFGLYGTRDNVELLRSTALVSFGAIQELLIEAIYLRTHRLLEEAVSRGKQRASMESLIQNLPETASTLRRHLKKRLAGVRRDCANIAEWRDRQVAHRDLATALRQHPSPLPPVQARAVGRTIEILAKSLTAISDKCGHDRPYDVHQEIADVDIHEVIRRLRAAGNR
jgi:hypothetical protein